MTMLLKSLRNVALLLVLVIGTAAFGLARSAPAAGQATPDAQAKIDDAMRAAPASIAKDATILDFEMDAEGHFVVLREGSNGWSCFPDFPGSPSDDLMCLDAMWMEWMNGLMANRAPQITGPGIAYMLQGGTDASNTDPFATEPAAGAEWVVSPPHLMILVPEDLDQTVFSTEPNNGGPWIMFPGTPYEHLMMPVAATENQG
jgi:hypothetical protein